MTASNSTESALMSVISSSREAGRVIGRGASSGDGADRQAALTTKQTLKATRVRVKSWAVLILVWFCTKEAGQINVTNGTQEADVAIACSRWVQPRRARRRPDESVA